MNFYEILEVANSASQDEIEKAYRKKALQYHPDRNPGNTEVHSKFINIQNAYDTLKDIEKRQQYDHSLNGDNGNFIFDLFDQENLDIKIIYKITIQDSINGAQKTLRFSKKLPCGTCKGFGATSFRKCEACQGSGHILNAINSIFKFQTLCGKCLGQGKIPLNKCEKCFGLKKANSNEQPIDFMIPKGIQNNMTLCLNGQGNIGNNGRVGNLYVQCVFEPDYVFKIDGLNLICNVRAKFSTMLFGGKIEIPTPENDVVEIEMPAKTECLTKLRVKNKGMYDIRNSLKRGDIIANVIVDMPQGFDNPEEVRKFLVAHGI